MYKQYRVKAGHSVTQSGIVATTTEIILGHRHRQQDIIYLDLQTGLHSLALRMSSVLSVALVLARCWYTHSSEQQHTVQMN